MDMEKMKSVLESSGLPVAYLSFPEEDAPPLPFVCYYSTDTNPLFADASTFYATTAVIVELYTQFKSPDVEKNLESVLSSYHWKKSETYIDTERCYMITYDIEV